MLWFHRKDTEKKNNTYTRGTFKNGIFIRTVNERNKNHTSIQ